MQQQKNGIKVQKSAKKKEVESAKKLSIVDTFGNFLATYTNFVFAVTQCNKIFFLLVSVIQCNKLNFCLSQGLSATNNIDNFFSIY